MRYHCGRYCERPRATSFDARVAGPTARATVSSSRETGYDDLTGAPSLAARDDKNASALIARSCSAQRAGVPP